MAVRSVDILINARDRASGIFGGVGKAFTSLSRRIFSAGGLITGALAGLGVTVGIKSFLDAATESADATAKLNAVLTSTGNVTGFTSAAIQGMAADLQDVTRFSDDAIVNGQAIMATFTNIRGDVFKDATVAAMNLSTVMGQDLQTSVTQIGKALQDPTKGMLALRRAGVSFTASQQEQIRALQRSGDLLGAQKIILGELQREFGGAAVAAGTTFAGKLDILKNNVGDLWEEIGFGIGDSVMAVFPQLGATVGAHASKITSWVDGAIVLFTQIEVAITHWRDHVVIAFLKWQLSTSNAADRMKWMAGIIGDFLGWIGRNWKDIFTTILNFTTTVFSNMASNIVAFVKNIPALMKGDLKFSDIWTPLTDGFEMTLKELPQIAAFENGALTKAMSAEIAAREAKIEAEEKKLIEERLARTQAMRDERAGKNVPTKSPVFNSPAASAFFAGGVPGLLGNLIAQSGINTENIAVKGAGMIEGGLAAVTGLFRPGGMLGLLGTMSSGPKELGKKIERSSGVAALEESRFLTGVGNASRENQPGARIEKKIEKTNNLLGDVKTALKNVALALREGAVKNAVFSGK
jgi:hypothetical protein